MMIHQTISTETYSYLWDSTPIGRSIDLRLCQLTPQLILEDKVLRSAIHLQNKLSDRSEIQFIGTLISDDETQRLTYVIDRLLLTNEINHRQPLTGEFYIPIQFNKRNSSTIRNLIQDSIKEIDIYCHSSLPIELHRFSSICGRISSNSSTIVNVNLSFSLVTVRNSFALTPINASHIQIFPTDPFETLCSSTRNHIHGNQLHFGYCSLDRTSKNKILFIPENDPQAYSLPLIGIWIFNITDIQCAFVWAACLRYLMNPSLKHRLRSGMNRQQSFLLVSYLPTSSSREIFYEVCSTTINNASSSVDYDLWTCSKNIIISSSSLNQYDINFSTKVPYDFEFKLVNNARKMLTFSGIHSEQISLPMEFQAVQSSHNKQFSTDIPFHSSEIYAKDEDHHYHEATYSSSNTNRSLFGVPRLPPKQSIDRTPSWDSLSTTTVTVPNQIQSRSVTSSKQTRSSSRTSSTMANDVQWKDELMKRMKSYETHMKSLTALVAQLLVVQKQQLQQNSQSISLNESTKRDVAVQSESSLFGVNDHMNESLLVMNNNQHNLVSSKTKHYQQQTSLINSTDTIPFTQIQSSSVVHQQEQTIDYSSLYKSTLPVQSLSSSLSTDLNPVDILEPIFRFIDNQQHQQVSQSTLMTTNNSNDRSPTVRNDNETNYHTENIFHSMNSIPQQQQQQQQQQQHVTSTRTTGISFTSNGVQMQFINQQSSTTTVCPQSQSVPTFPSPPSTAEHFPTSPQQSENNLSIEVHGLEMKYLEDDQLAIAIECDRQSQTLLNTLPQSSQNIDKSLSFETQEYLRRYNLFAYSDS